MPANQNFAKRTGECMKDVKPEHGKVRMHARARTHLHSLHCAPPRTSARLRARAPISSFYWRSPLAPFMALVVPAPPPPLPLTPYPSPLTLQGLREPR